MLASGFLRMVVLCGFLVAVDAPAQGPGVVDNGTPTFTTFGVSGASGTYPRSINRAGGIAGQYDTKGAVNGSFTHGFVRAADGSIASFDAPGGIHTIGTSTQAINAGGTVTGYYEYEVSQEDGGVVPLAYGFVRAVDGSFTTFSAPGAGTGGYPANQGTYPLSINAAGTITGYYIDANGVSHGFTRTGRGTLTSFDAPEGGSGTNSGQGNLRGEYQRGGGYRGILR
jgi:hypothetical protein